MTKVYFPNLNGVRFLAVLIVIISHIEQIKHFQGLDNLWTDIPSLGKAGHTGVILFFVLSGFLITYLLLVEEEQTQTIAIKDFYIRRLLRIWPLYYLVIALSFLALPHIPFFHINELSDNVFSNWIPKITLFLLFFPNIALVMYSPVAYVSQTWSVGVEEQFYLFWPVLMKKCKNKAILLGTATIGYYLLDQTIFPFVEKNIYWNPSLEIISEIVTGMHIDCLAMGGVFAFLYHKKHPIVQLLYYKPLQLIVFPLTLLLLFLGVDLPYINEVYSILFGIIILNLATNPKVIINLEIQPLKFLGKISYGLYMYHVIAIAISLKLLSYISITNWIIQYALSIGLSVLISTISYNYLESYFIRKKLRFSKIISGENVHENAGKKPENALV